MEEDLKRIAARIRRWRDEADLTLQQLGDRSGVSASTIHKIENHQTIPTIAVLLKIANGLNRRPSQLLSEADAENQIAVLRRDDRPHFLINKQTHMEHLVGMIPRNKLDVWRVRIEAGRGVGRPGTDAWQFNGEVVILVEEGCVEAEIGTESFALDEGDSIHFDPSIPHRWIAGGGKSAVLMVLAMVPSRLQSDLVSQIASSTLHGGDEGVESSDVSPVGKADVEGTKNGGVD